MTWHVCPECGGEGRIEYERAVVDWDNGGFLEGYLDDCFRCDGSGEVQIDFSFLSWARDCWGDAKYLDPNANLKSWFKAERQRVLDEWRSEVGLISSFQ